MPKSTKNKNRKYIYALLLVTIVAVGFLMYQGGYIFAKPKDGMIITVYYEDGTYDIFDSHTFKEKGLGIVSMSGAKIDYIRTELYLTAETNTPITNYDVTGQLRFQILEGTTVRYDSQWNPLTPLSPKPTLANNQAVVISSSTISSQDIKNLYSGWTVGNTYTLAWGSSQVTVTAHFPDGDQQQTANPAQGNINVKYASDASFTGLSASFYTTTS